MKKGRKPGEASKARARHMRQQALRDKLAEMRLNGAAWISAWDARERKYVRRKVVPEFNQDSGVVLAKVAGRMQFIWLSDKYSGYYVADGVIDCFIPQKQIFGFVVDR